MPFRKDSVRTPRLKASKFFTVRSGFTKRNRRTKRSSHKEGVELKGISTANISIHQRDTRLKSNQFQKPRKKPGKNQELVKNSWHGLKTTIPIGSMVLLYMVTWIPSIYPLYVSIYIPYMDPMGFKHKILWMFFWNRECAKASRALLGKLEPRDSFQCPKVSGQLPVQTNIQKPIPELQAQWAQLAKFGQLCQCSHPWEWDPLSGINQKLDAKILKRSPKNGISCPRYPAQGS